MIVNKIKLYKTPLDSAYVNVFDAYTKIEDYENFLTAKYPPLIIELSQSKSIRASDGLSEVVLPYYQNSIRDYNYLQITNNEGTYFYFIVGTVSLDDGNAPSTRLELKWDAWTNNYTNVNYLYGTIERKLVNSSFIRNYNAYNEMELVPNQLPLFNFQTPLDVIGSFSISEMLVNETDVQNAIVLWLECKMREQVYYILDEGSTVRVKTSGCYPHYASTPIVYYPVAIVNSKTRKVFTNFNIIDAVPAPGGITKLDLRTVVNDKAAVLSARLTFLPPFKYSVHLGSIASAVDIITEAPRSPLYYSNDTSNATYFSPYIEGTFAKCVWRSGLVSDITKRVDIEQEIVTCDNKMKLFNSVDFTFNKACEGVMFAYPFKYYQLYINGSQIPAVHTYNNRYLYIDVDNRNTPSVKYRIRLTSNDNKPYISVSNLSSILTRADQYDIYMASNGNRLALEKVKNIGMFAGSVAAVVTTQGAALPAVGGTIYSSMSNIMNMFQTYKDLENAPDNINNPSLDALEDLHYHDDIIIQHVECNSEFLSDNFYKNYHYYGIELGSVGDMISIEHYTFDFTKGEPICENITNINDKIEIKSAFARGVTRWHIDAENDINNLTTFNKNTINLERGAWENQ